MTTTRIIIEAEVAAARARLAYLERALASLDGGATSGEAEALLMPLAPADGDRKGGLTMAALTATALRAIARAARDALLERRPEVIPHVHREHLQALAVAIAELRPLCREAGVDIDAVGDLPRRPAVIRARLRAVEGRMTQLHQRAPSRARATTREANLARLAQEAEALRAELERAEEAERAEAWP